MSKSKHISVTYDNNGDVVSVGKVKVVDESRAAELQEQANKTQDKMDREKQMFIKVINDLDNRVRALYHLVAHLIGNEDLNEEEINNLLEELVWYDDKRKN